MIAIPSLRNAAENPSKQRIFRTQPEEHNDSQQLTTRTLVQDMRGHGELLSGNTVSSRRVKVKLLQRVVLLPDRELTCILETHAHGMAIVGQFQRLGMVVKNQFGHLLLFAVPDINGRLLSTGLAQRGTAGTDKE